MVYLLHAYFGRDGREEAESLLQRRSGDPDKPRILGAFNEATPDWLSFFMFSFFTDRDGKYQLAALAESGFDPLSRTCRFMLTEEAHHMFVGESGRGAHRAADLRADARAQDRRRAPPRRDRPGDDPAVPQLPLLGLARPVRLGGLDQRRQLLHDGLKGRFEETKETDDHLLKEATYRRSTPVEAAGSCGRPALTALNERLRDDYVADCQRGVLRWNAVIKQPGIDVELKLPHRGFHRAIGNFAELRVSPDGRIVSEAEWDAREPRVAADRRGPRLRHLLMRPAVIEPGKFANWIAPPARGINGQPVEFEYVRFN